MKQITFQFHNIEQLKTDLTHFRLEISEKSNFYFQLLTPVLDKNLLEDICSLLSDLFPQTVFTGNTTSGNIVDCTTVNEIIIAANIFEYESSKFQVFQYDLNQYTPSVIARNIVKEASVCPWVKAVEIYWTITEFSTSELCDGLKYLDENIKVFGGIVCSPDITSNQSFVFSSDHGLSEHAVLIIFYGGPDLHIESLKISGWKPIGRNFLVTKSSGSRLYELGGIPAYEIYKKYLNIQNDANFFYNALDFPMMYEHNNTTLVRAPSSSNEDGSLNMSSDIEVGEIIRLSYGDTQTILDIIEQKSFLVKNFEPDVLHIFSCAARKAFWSPYEPTHEIQPLKGIGTSVGFFSHGEFIRENNYVNQHNITLVIAGMREGPKKFQNNTVSLPAEKPSTGRLPLAARMATFIRETSYELEEINAALQSMNVHLEDLASTDSLTGLKNRLSYNEYLKSIPLDETNHNWVMLMMDVNGLKYTNDTFGHLAGDDLIISTAKVLLTVFGQYGNCFRIGGDEFCVIINISTEALSKLIQDFYRKIRLHNKDSLYRLSVAVGMSHLRNENNSNKSISDWKLDADLDMYKDKTMIHHRLTDNPEMQNHKELINCLITIEEAKDPYTAHHSDRVSLLSTAIAKAMGLTENTIKFIGDAAHLHDIGKVGVSDAILFKPSFLSEEEFKVIKEHPVIGARILMQSNYTQEMVQIVLHHHERYDGKGYPDQLAGLDIPIGARIVALADSIDAMTSKRVYRDAMTLEECYKEIQRNLGKMYDPAIGKICLKNWEMIEKIIGKELGPLDSM